MGSPTHLLAVEPNCSAAGTDLGFFHYISLFLFPWYFFWFGAAAAVSAQCISIFKAKMTYFERTLERDIKVTFYVPFCS